MADRTIAAGKLEALLRDLKAQHAKTGELLETFENLLLEEATPGAIAKKWLVTEFGARWRKRHSIPFIPTWAKDIATVKRLLAQLDVDELTTRVDRYFDHRDPYLMESCYPLGLFATNINRYGAKSDRNDATFLESPPIGCTHRPMCKSDVAHTQRCQKEMRG